MLPVIRLSSSPETPQQQEQEQQLQQQRQRYRSAFVDYASAPFHDHEAAQNPVKPVLATAALRHVYNRVTRLKTDGRLEEGMKVDAGTAVRLLKEVMGLVDSGT